MDQAVRRQGLGGSDIAAILGLDDHRDPFGVYQEKTGQLSPTVPTFRMKLGKYCERGIIHCYTDLTGRPTEFLDLLQVHPERPWMLYTPDAVCTQEKRGVDAKLVQWDQRDLWGEGPDDIPFRAQLQGHWYMAAMDYPVWDFIAIIDAQPRIYSIHRDLEIEAYILGRAEAFWRDHILAGKPPRIGSSESSARYLRERFPRHREVIRPANLAEVRMLEQYAGFRVTFDQMTTEKKGLENAIKQAIGEDAGLAWSGGRFTWKRTKDSQTTDWRALAQSLMGDRTEEEQKALAQAFTTPEAGVRRMDFRLEKAS